MYQVQQDKNSKYGKSKPKYIKPIICCISTVKACKRSNMRDETQGHHSVTEESTQNCKPLAAES